MVCVPHLLSFLSCVVFVFFFLLRLVSRMLSMSLDCPLLIAPSVFSNVYFLHNKMFVSISKLPVSLVRMKYVMHNAWKYTICSIMCQVYLLILYFIKYFLFSVIVMYWYIITLLKQTMCSRNS